MPFEQYITLSQEAFYHNKGRATGKNMDIEIRKGRTLYGCQMQGKKGKVSQAFYF